MTVQTCGSLGCVLPAGHNMGRADVPENHRTDPYDGCEHGASYDIECGACDAQGVLYESFGAVTPNEQGIAHRAHRAGVAASRSDVETLLAKYAGRSKWVGYEQPRREAWAEIETDLRDVLDRWSA